MGKKVALLRHAKADHNNKIDDHERPLNQEGVDACVKLAAHLAEEKFIPDVVLCSPSARTKATLEVVLETYPFAAAFLFSPALYLASAGEILREINTLNENFSSVLVIGHNPGLHHLGVLLTKNSDGVEAGVFKASLPTAAFARFECEVDCWRAVEMGTGVLKEFFRP